MPETSTCEDTSTVTTVTTSTENDTTTTTTSTQTCTKTVQTTPDSDSGECGFCGRLNLDKLAEQTRCTALKSSNLAVANSNAILLFTQLVMQEILKNECRRKNPNTDRIFSAAATIAALAENYHLYNPQPFNP